MPSIRLLPPEIVNRIAAGEVVERPASIVKELVENAIDAHATEIEVDIEEGGRRRVTVRDNGHGMDGDDLRLAFQSHATSKLREEDCEGGLFGIATLGFRGEALASIAAVAEVEAVSRPPRSEHAFRYVPARDEIKPAAAPPGTVIEVRNLFYNVPARRKFLRAATAETSRIVEQMTRLALGFPSIRFRLTSAGGRVHLDCAVADSLRERVLQIVGDEHALDLVEVRGGDDENPPVLRGFVGLPAWRARNASHQHFFVNGRWVRDRSLSHALRSAYQGLLVPGLHPVGYLFLDFAPESVDVNVHPTKTEVRFRDSGRVFPFVLRAVRDALADARGELRSARSEADADESAIESLARDEGTFAIASERLETASDGGAALSNAELDRLRVERAAKDFLARGGHADLRSHRSSARQMSFLGGDARKADSVRLDRSRGAGEASYGINAERSIERSGERTGAPSASKAAPRSAVQVLDTFLLVEEGDGIVLYDQHALHEKILFEDILRRLEGGGIVRQRLIVPEVVTLLPEHVPLLDDALPLLESCGYEVEPFGARDVAVRAVPELFSRVRRMERPAEFLHDAFRLLLESDGGARDDLAQGARALREGPLRALASLLACKQAVKAGTRLRPEEIAALLGRAELADDPENCPHGRPTAVRMSRREIERRFDRR